MAVLPIIALALITILSVYNINQVSEKLEQTLYEEGYAGASLLLNADRDLYQALSALQEVVNQDLSQSKIDE